MYTNSFLGDTSDQEQAKGITRSWCLLASLVAREDPDHPLEVCLILRWPLLKYANEASFRKRMGAGVSVCSFSAEP